MLCSQLLFSAVDRSQCNQALTTLITVQVGYRDHNQNAGGGLTEVKQAPLKVQIWGAVGTSFGRCTRLAREGGN